MTGKEYLNDRVKVNTSDLFKRMLGVLEDIKHDFANSIASEIVKHKGVT